MIDKKEFDPVLFLFLDAFYQTQAITDQEFFKRF